MNVIYTWFGGRKYFLALLFYVLVTVGFFLKWLEAEAWLNALEWCLALYLGANVVQELPDALSGKVNGKSKFYEWFGGRKMLLAFIFMLTITVAFFLPQSDGARFLPSALWISGLEWCLGIYLGANALSAVPDAIGRKKNGGAPPAPPAQPA